MAIKTVLSGSQLTTTAHRQWRHYEKPPEVTPFRGGDTRMKENYFVAGFTKNS